MCLSSECISSEKKCNGIKDCVDGSDELGCSEFDCEDLTSNEEIEYSNISSTFYVLPDEISPLDQCPYREGYLFITDVS